MRAVSPHLLAAAALALAAAACAPEAPQGTIPVAPPPAPEGLSPRALIQRAWQRPEPPAPPIALAAVAFATAQVGKPYCWGGTGPRCFDCSGLAQRAWRSVGVALPRTADAMRDRLAEVPLEDVRAGDILWWPGHVGIYAGGGWAVEALDARHGVVVRPAWSPHRALRPL